MTRSPLFLPALSEAPMFVSLCVCVPVLSLRAVVGVPLERARMMTRQKAEF